MSIRRLWLDTEAAAYAREQLSFPGLQILLRVDHERRDDRAVTVETRYFACSADPAVVTPVALLAWVRGHWSVENSLHFLKDRWWDEDRHWTRRPGLSEWLAQLTTASCASSAVTPTCPYAVRPTTLPGSPNAGLKFMGVG